MFKSPKGFITLGECDVPFKLPSDTRLYRKYYNMHYRQRRDLYSHLETAFNRYTPAYILLIVHTIFIITI